MLRVAVLLSLLAASIVHAQPGRSLAPTPSALPPAARSVLGLASDGAERTYVEGRAEALGLRFDAAQAAFARLGRADGPAGAYGMETTALWRALITEDGRDADRFYALNDSLGDVADALPEGPDAEWLRATVALHRALAQAREERYTRAGLAFRDACGRFRRLTSGANALPDARFGQGVCEIAAGSVPRKYRWLTRLVGFSGTIAGGLEHLAAAADAGAAQAAEAVVVLAVVDQLLNEGRAGGQDRLAALAAAHPQSPGIAYLDGYHAYVERRAGDAEQAFRRAAVALERPGALPLPTLSAHLGMTLFRQDRFADAAPLLERYVREARGQALLAQTTLHVGLAYEMAGDRRRAESFYRRVRATRDYDTDLSAAREAARLLQAPMDATRRTLLLGATAFDSGRYDEAVRLLRPVLTDAEAVASERAEAAYRTGRAFQVRRQWDEAVRHFELALRHPDDPQARWGPWATFHIGEIRASRGDASGARAAFRDVLANEAEFDYSKALEQRARAALDRLGTRG